MKFDPTIAIIILALFSFFCSSVYSSCKRRRLTSRESSTTFRVAGVHNGDAVEAAKGLERSVIESFPVFRYNQMTGLNGSECAVCLIDFEDHEILRLLPKCNHAFHPECIDTWLRTNITCPLCRTTLLQSTDSGVAEPQQSSEQLTIVTDNGGAVSSQGNDFSNEEATIETAGKHQASSSLGQPAYFKSGGSAEKRSKSERWGSNMSINPASIIRTFSMRVSAGDREGDGTERSQGGTGSSRVQTCSW